MCVCPVAVRALFCVSVEQSGWEAPVTQKVASARSTSACVVQCETLRSGTQVVLALQWDKDDRAATVRETALETLKVMSCSIFLSPVDVDGAQSSVSVGWLFCWCCSTSSSEFLFGHRQHSFGCVPPPQPCYNTAHPSLGHAQSSANPRSASMDDTGGGAGGGVERGRQHDARGAGGAPVRGSRCPEGMRRCRTFPPHPSVLLRAALFPFPLSTHSLNPCPSHLPARLSPVHTSPSLAFPVTCPEEMASRRCEFWGQETWGRGTTTRR